MDKPLVGIIMGSDSDLPLMQEAASVLKEFGVPFEITVVSAHRTPEKMFQYAKSAQSRGLLVIIACAGGSAHLPGMTAALTALPVIGVPRKLKDLDGLDSLLSIVQMPAGIPVATVAIDGAKNAGILAARIIAIKDPTLSQKLSQYSEDLRATVELKADKLESAGYKDYIETLEQELADKSK